MNTLLIIPSSGTIDLYEDVGISLTYNIADIKEPQTRNSDYSKTITVPGSNNNNKLLSHIYEIGIDRLFNPNHKVTAWVTYGGVRVFKGYMRLAKIRKLKGENIEYDLELKGRLDDLFSNMGDTKLSDLTWTDLNHTYSRANIVASWSAPIGSNYVYPFIDYGYSSNITQYNVNHFFPAVYVKEAFDRAFRYAGFHYSSAFLTSTYFKSLIMPFTSDTMRLTASQIEARNFKASRSSTHQKHVPFSSSGTTYQYFTNIFNDDSSTGNTDGGNNYNTSTGIYTVPATGRYDIVANLTFDAIAAPNLPNQFINYNIRAFPRLIVNGAAKVYGSLYDMVFPGVTTISTHSSEMTGTENNNVYLTYSAYLNAGDTIYIDFQARLLSWFTPPAPGNVNYHLRLKTGSYFYAKADPIIKEGSTITFAHTLPNDMKIKDFIISIIKMHNLYFEYDKDIPNKIFIEPRNDYYTNNVVDWSSKLDASKNPEIIPMGALNTKRYKFSYKKDEDVLNKTYQTTYGEIYGEKHIDIDNDFVKNTETLEVIFSPTPQYGIVNTGRFYPAMYNVDSALKKIHNKSMNPRILYYGGLKSCNKWWLFSGNVMGATLSSYPYCGMMDDPETPTISIDFGVPREVYYTPTFNGGYSNNNLYNKYWKQFIDEITDYNSSIITAWFWLNPSDIAQIDFRYVYRFLGQNFRLNKIYDYNPSDNSLTRCEFIKIKQGIPFSPQTKPMGGGAVNSYYDDAITRVPYSPSSEGPGGSSPQPIGFTQIIQGQRNYISPAASNVRINGNDNSVGTDCENIEIINSSGVVVSGGLVNVSVYNSSGVTVTESNSIIENNAVISSPSTGTAGQWIGLGNNIYNGNSGNVGIGTSTPGNKLAIWRNSGDSIPALGQNGGTFGLFRDGLYGYLLGQRSDGKIFMQAQRIDGSAIAYELMLNPNGGDISIGSGRLFGSSIHNNAASVTGTTNQYIASGTYTPTAADIVNLDATPTTYESNWIRVGNVVSVSGEFDANPTVGSGAGAATSFTLTLPIASTTAATSDLSGTAASGQVALMSAAIRASSGKASVFWVATDTSNRSWSYTFMYEIL